MIVEHGVFPGDVQRKQAAHTGGMVEGVITYGTMRGLGGGSGGASTCTDAGLSAYIWDPSRDTSAKVG